MTSAEILSGTTSIIVMHGDITELDAAVIVNAANNRLIMGGGVANAIKRKGGKEIEIEAMAKGPIAVGDAIATSGGSLPAEHVIHAAVMGLDFQTDTSRVHQATMSSLLLAEDLEAETIGFPAFGTGIGRLSAGDSARAMYGAVREYLYQGKTVLTTITFVLFEDDIAAVFAKELVASFGREG